VQQVAVEAVVGAMLGQIIVDGAIRQTHDRPQLALNGLRSAQSGQRVARPCALHQIADRVLFAEAQAEALDVADQPLVAATFGVGEQIGESRPRQLLLGAALDRLESGRNPRLGRERRKQRLGEAMDGLDAQSAGRVEDPREQPPSPLHSKRIIGFA
jgi:hypothetical protein